MKHAHLKGNTHSCKEYPRDARWDQRANSVVKSMAKQRAIDCEDKSLGDYLERLVIEDLNESRKTESPPQQS
jgi:hypothetical protein